MTHIEVAIAAPLPETLTYALQDSLADNLELRTQYIGKRVLVPLGKRKVTGYIVDVLEKKEEVFAVRKVVAILDDHPLFHENCVEFFRWVAQYYHYPLGEVLQTALPPGINSNSRTVVRYNESKRINDNELFATKEPPEWYKTLCRNKILTHTQTRALLKNSKETRVLKQLAAKHVLSISHEIGGNSTKKKEERCYRSKFFVKIDKIGVNPNKDDLLLFQKDLEDICEQSFKLTEIKTLYYFFSLCNEKDVEVPRKELLALYKGAATPLKNLVERGVLQEYAQRVYRNPLGILPETCEKPIHLTDEQQRICDHLQICISRKEFYPNLLFGVTGGGKTEIYLQMAQCCLQNGRDVLVLVPEIALATQLESQFISRFPDIIALLHSGLSSGERFDQWTLAAQGKARIVIGARSAVFAPLRNIGLIIVDEEHDGGYKQDDGLKYNGRDLAVLRGQKQQCTVLLGTATPSIGSYRNALEGKYNLLHITRRIGKSVLPDVEVIDLNQKKKGDGILTNPFLSEMKATIKRGEQSLVLLNRRGFSASYLCQDCGASVQCRHCKVSMTYHKKREELKCHYCGYISSSRLLCDNCSSTKLVPFGVGTERVEEEILEQFPGAVIKRLDSDTASKRSDFFSVLQKMKKGEIDILIGTQMIAKGHHFPGVTFVGVVWADGGLSIPDFRASERTYQLLSQVTGRAGRGDKKGKVLIQTMRPGHYAIECAKNHSYELFYEKEIMVRKRPVFPPFVRLVQIRISGENEYHVRKTATEMADICRKWNHENGGGCEILGPATAPLEMINNNFRWQVLLKSRQQPALHALIHHIEKRRRKIVLGKTIFTIDVDPENMM